MHAEFQLPSMPGTGSSMVGEDNNKQNSVELEASLAPAEAEVGAVADQPAEAEVGAVAKADQKYRLIFC